MKLNSCVVDRLLQHNLNIVFPHKDYIERLHQIIVDELANNIFTEESKDFYIKAMKRLYDDEQIEGIILGCTGKVFYFQKNNFISFIFKKFLYLLNKVMYHMYLSLIQQNFM